MTATINASTTAGVVTTADTSGILQLQTNGTAALTVDASQNVGIGTASPTARLTIASGTNEGAVRVGDNATYYGAFARVQATDEVRLGSYGASQKLTFYTVSSERMRITSAGLVGIGTTSPIGDLTVSKAGAEGIEFIPASSSGVCTTQYYNRSSAAYVSNAQNASVHSWLTSGTERARIDSSGNLLVGTTSNSGERLGVSFTGTQGIRIDTTSTNATLAVQFVYNNSTEVGKISTTTTSTAYNTSSDYRLKHDIAPMTGALAKVAALKPVTYKWNIDNSESQGFIAHELAEVVPDCVTGEKDAVDAEGNPQYQGIDTSFLVATLTAAIQELKAIVDGQAVLIAAQGAEIAALKGATA